MSSLWSSQTGAGSRYGWRGGVGVVRRGGGTIGPVFVPQSTRIAWQQLAARQVTSSRQIDECCKGEWLKVERSVNVARSLVYECVRVCLCWCVKPHFDWTFAFRSKSLPIRSLRVHSTARLASPFATAFQLDYAVQSAIKCALFRCTKPLALELDSC